MTGSPSAPRVSRRLLAGQILSAWRAYPAARRALARMRPGPPILVTGAPRSGTTWAGTMLAVPGVWHVHEPFNPSRGAWPERFTFVPPDAPDGRVDALMRRLLSGRLRRLGRDGWTQHPAMPLRLFPQPIRRVLIKDPIACLLSAYLTRRFDMRTIVLMRHPCGFVASMRRLGWSADGLLARLRDTPEIADRWLAPWRGILRSPLTDPVERLAFACGALYTVLLAYCREDARMLAVRYEDLCADPISRFRRLFEHLDLPYDGSTASRHAELSLREFGGAGAYRTHTVRRNSRAMKDRWRGELTGGEIGRVRAAWERFDLPFYRAEADW